MKRIPAILALVAVSALVLGVGASLAARSASPIGVKLNEMSIVPAALRAPAGKVSFAVKNVGKLPHEIVVIRTNLAPGKLPVTGAEASEKGKVGESGNLATGKSKTVTLTLSKGRYVVICNIAGHYQAGMRGSLVVG